MVRALMALMLVAALPAEAQDKAQSLAELYGHTLGAAALCPAIASGRLSTVAERASRHLREVAGSEAAAKAAAQALATAIDQGKRDLTDGMVTCAQAESELANLEHELSP